MKSLEITKDIMERLAERFGRKLMVAESTLGRLLSVGEVMQLICDISESKEDAVRLCSFITYQDLQKRVKEGEEI
jgi:hypothetical protein